MKTLFKTILALIGGLLVLGVAFVLWAKVPSPTPENTVKIKGKVAAVSSPCCNDIVLSIEGDHHVYYINHGVDLGIEASDWHEMMKGLEVELTYVLTRWNPFNAKGRHRPLSGVEFEQQSLFDMDRDWKAHKGM